MMKKKKKTSPHEAVTTWDYLSKHFLNHHMTAVRTGVLRTCHTRKLRPELGYDFHHELANDRPGTRTQSVHFSLSVPHLHKCLTSVE